MTKAKVFLWIFTGILILLMFPGLNVRLDNERNNMSVVPVAEYNEFSMASGMAHIDFDGVLSELLENGVKTLAVREITLADLSRKGDISISPLGEYFSFMQKIKPELAEKVKAELGEYASNPFGYLAVTGSRDTARFMAERLDARFGSGQYKAFELDGQSFIYIRAEIDDRLTVGLGYDRQILKTIKDKGFDIVLLPRKSYGDGYDYLEEYDSLIKEFGVRYILFDGKAVAGAPGRLEEMAEIIRSNNLIFGIIETATQIGYVEQQGIDSLMEETGYAINRVYQAPDAYLQKLDSEDLFYQWMRGVVDRNIRIVYINPLKNQKLTYRQNIEDTIRSVREFTSFISARGYRLNGPIPRLSSMMPGRLHYTFVALSLICAGILYLLYLFQSKFKLRFAAVLAALGVVLAITASAVLGDRMAKPLALAAAIVYPSLSSLVLLRHMKKGGEKTLAKSMAVSLGIVVGINAAGMYSVVATLSDIRYTMMVDMFQGVKLSFVIPVVLFAVSYLFCFAGYGKIKDYLVKLSGRKVTYLAAGISLAGALAFYLYIARSGNAMGVSASSLELKIREVFERTLAARPRLKEFFIGYPALFAMIYLYRRFRMEIIPFILGFGVVVGSVSMVNSFCHVFTSVSVSAMRTLYGLIIGAVLGTVLLILLDIALKFIPALSGAWKDECAEE
jgi:hypothetical protein